MFSVRYKTEVLYIFVYFSFQTVKNAIETNFCTYEFNLDPLKPSGHYMYHQFNIHKFYVVPHTVYLCVLFGSQNKQRLFPYTTLTDWIFNTDLTL